MSMNLDSLSAQSHRGRKALNWIGVDRFNNITNCPHLELQQVKDVMNYGKSMSGICLQRLKSGLLDMNLGSEYLFDIQSQLGTHLSKII